MSSFNIKQETKITWSNVTASISDKTILSEASGQASPGDIVAIMGPSGAGKTTLLSILAYKRAKQMIISGQVKANGAPFNQKSYYTFGSFVYQSDLLFQVLTVRENIEFAASLKLRGSQEYKQEKVEQLIDQLDLRKCQNTYIGGKFVRGISGGQRKRTCIAIELVANPSVLILDEPTSGLDSTTAFNIVKTLERLSSKGKTIIFTIHQPSSKIFNTLKKLIILHKGETIYHGQASHIVSYLQKLQITVPKHFNISDFFMFELSDYKRKKTGKESPLNNKNYTQMLEPFVNNKDQSQYQSQLNIGFQQRSYASNILYEIIKIFNRAVKSYFRHPMMFRTVFIRAFINVLIVGGIFFQVGVNKKPSGVVSNDQLQNYLFGVQGMIFFTVFSNFVIGVFSVFLVFPMERQIYTKEQSSKTYRCQSYFLGKILLEIPLCLIFPIIFGCIVYWMVGLTHTVHQYLIYNFTLIIASMSGNALGLLAGSIFSDPKYASSIGSIIFLPLMIASGVYNRVSTMSAYIGWLQYISPFYYGFKALVYNEFSEQLFFIETPNGIISYSITQELGIRTSSMQTNLIFTAMIMGYYMLSYICLKYFPSKLIL